MTHGEMMQSAERPKFFVYAGAKWMIVKSFVTGEFCNAYCFETIGGRYDCNNPSPQGHYVGEHRFFEGDEEIEWELSP